MRTYDTDAGYNHKGIDVYSWPFGWLKMDLDEVEILAAEPGHIIGKDDGNFDRNCSFTGNWNAVYVQHADGSVAWYGHLKKNSLTSKSVGQSVAAGELLGIMGSSGQSTGPHLHFEVYDSGNKLVDPSQGACNALNVDSWWYWSATLPANPQVGAWRWHLSFEDQQAETMFFIGTDGVFADGFEE